MFSFLFTGKRVVFILLMYTNGGNNWESSVHFASLSYFFLEFLQFLKLRAGLDQDRDNHDGRYPPFCTSYITSIAHIFIQHAFPTKPPPSNSLISPFHLSTLPHHTPSHPSSISILEPNYTHAAPRKFIIRVYSARF